MGCGGHAGQVQHAVAAEAVEARQPGGREVCIPNCLHLVHVVVVPDRVICTGVRDRDLN